MLLPVRAIANDVPPKSELVGAPNVVSFSVLAFKSVVSALDVVEAVGTEFEGATNVDPNLKMGAPGNDGDAAEVDGLLLKAVTMVVSLELMVAVIEEATLVKLFVKV